jgi:hypothetical protein
MAHRDDGTPTAVLVEAKANMPEFSVGSRGATNPRSIRMIDAALDQARVKLGATASLALACARSSVG